MTERLSRSEKKRQAKRLEELAKELICLSKQEIKKIPATEYICEEILIAQPLKSGAKKRQIKYLTKCLREIDCTPILDHLSSQKGSKLKETAKFHDFERMRDDIITDVLEAHHEAQKNQEKLAENYHSPALNQVMQSYQVLNENDLRQSAMKFVRTRKTTHTKEIFRLIRAAAEKTELTPLATTK